MQCAAHFLTSQVLQEPFSGTLLMIFGACVSKSLNHANMLNFRFIFYQQQQFLKKEDLAQEIPWATISKTLQELRTVFIKSFYYRKQLYIKCVFLLFHLSRFHYEVSLSLPLSLLLAASLAFFLPRNCRGVRFHFWILLIIEYVCLSVCLSVCVCHQKTPHQRYMHHGYMPQEYKNGHQCWSEGPQ